MVVSTRLGETTVPLEDVAVLIGGGGLGRPMRVHLRNGEVLVGKVEAEELTLDSESGLEVRLTPEDVNVLFTRTRGADGIPPAGTVALVTTHRGDQLALRADCPSKLRAMTAWGPVEVEYFQTPEEREFHVRGLIRSHALQ